MPARQNRAVVAHPLCRESKTVRLVLARYIGTGKLRDFCFPDISGRENCATFAFPIYRDGKTARLLLSRYIGTGKLREFWRPDISSLKNCLRVRSETVHKTVSKRLFVVLHSITD